MMAQAELFDASQLIGEKCQELRSWLRGGTVPRHFSREQWREFVACAKGRWSSGTGVHNEYDSKRPKHPVPDSVVLRTIGESARILSYVHWDTKTIGIWSDATGVLLVIRLCPVSNEPAIFNALEYDDIGDPGRAGDMTNIEWLN